MSDAAKVTANAPDGLFGKYQVMKDGAPLDGPSFVLRYDRDPHAKVALRAYADSILKENVDLATDLYDALGLLGEPVGPFR